MKIFTMCMECQKELGHPSFEPIIADYYEESLAFIECSRGHKSAILLQSQKFEVLLESAVNALIEGYTLEAASSLSSAYERFFEFAINVFCKKNNIPKEALEETYKQVSKQSGRQIGGFLFLHLLAFGSHYTLNKRIPELRNRVIHQGYIPTPEEVVKFGEMIYQEILDNQANQFKPCQRKAASNNGHTANTQREDPRRHTSRNYYRHNVFFLGYGAAKRKLSRSACQL